jgi:hypothetical protein
MKSVWLFISLLALLLTACVPQAQTDLGPSVAVINAPTDFRVRGLADKLQTELQRNSAPNAYSFVSRSRVEFQETHRDMAGSRAPLQAAFIARAFGAGYSVIVAAPVFERGTEEFVFGQTLKREVSTEVQLEARIIDPATAEVLSTYRSGVYKGFRVEFFNTDDEVVEEDKDPDLNAGIGRALNEIAPGLATDLELFFSRQTQAVTQ